MIPKSSVVQKMMTESEAEAQIDHTIKMANLSNSSAPRTSVDLHPVTRETVDKLCAKYQAGGWTTAVDGLRMPDGYRLTLS